MEAHLREGGGAAAAPARAASDATVLEAAVVLSQCIIAAGVALHVARQCKHLQTIRQVGAALVARFFAGRVQAVLAAHPVAASPAAGISTATAQHAVDAVGAVWQVL